MDLKNWECGAGAASKHPVCDNKPAVAVLGVQYWGTKMFPIKSRSIRHIIRTRDRIQECEFGSDIYKVFESVLFVDTVCPGKFHFCDAMMVAIASSSLASRSGR